MRTAGLLRWASGILIALGLGHLAVVALTAGQHFGAWVDRGLWASVPFMDQEAASAQDTVTFWAGPGGFAVPQILLGCLVWHLARRGSPVPAGIGWVLAAWGLLDGVLLGPSPFFACLVPGTLIVLAGRKSRQRQEKP